MQFSRLSASIANNAEEAPSIYMAICMIESLLDDMEDVTGQEISDCPIGDDTLPTKMVWLCQVLSQIYKEKNQELIRNRSRLDTAMGELKKVNVELEPLSETAKRLSAAKADLKKKRAALEQARAEQAEYEEIKERCRQLQMEADALGRFDRASAETKLRALQAETADLAQVKSDLETEYASVLASRDELVEKTADLRLEIDKAAALVEQKNNALSGMEKQRLEAQRRESELTDQLRDMTETLSGLQDAVSQLQTEKIPARKRQRDEEAARKTGLEQALASLDRETGQIQEKNKVLSAKIEKAKEDFNTFSSEYSWLTEDYQQKNEEIAALVHRLEDLKGKTDAQKHNIYKRQIEEQIGALEKTEQDCTAMERQLEKLGRSVQEKQRMAEELREKQARAGDVERRISEVLRELAPAASEDFLPKLEENRQRLILLESVRGNLAGTLSDMREILGEMPVDDNGAALDNMKGVIHGLLHYTEQMQKDLVLYAKSVTLGEK